MNRRQALPLHALRAFEAAARHRSLLRGAEELSVTHGAISQQIKLLERVLKKQLFDRTKRPIALTSAGQQLLSAVTESFGRLARTTTAIENGELEGEITLSCVPGLAANWLVPALHSFLASHSGISLRIKTEYWRHPTAADHVDLAVVYGSAEHPGKKVTLLGHSEFFPVGSPKLVGSKRKNFSAGAITQFTLLHEYSSETWSRWFVSMGSNLPDSRGVTFDGAHLTLQAARFGAGVAMGDLPTVRNDLEQGHLLRLSDVSVPAAHPYYLVTSPETANRPDIKALEDWLIALSDFSMGTESNSV
jgi:DNA-binding transcriptional LysR family regulator